MFIGNTEIGDGDSAAMLGDAVSAALGDAASAALMGDAESAALGDAVSAALMGNTEIGNAEIGDGVSAALMGNAEIGDGDSAAMLGDGDSAAMLGDGVSAALMGNIEIGDDDQAQAALAVIKTARDNRQRAPRMRALPVDSPDPGVSTAVDDWLAECFIGAAETTGQDQFPLTTALMVRFGAGQAGPRVVRVDTEESYQEFRTDSSPELAEVRDHVDALEDAFREHAHDPEAHGELQDAIQTIDMLGADAAEAEADKIIDLWLPKWAEGKVRAWREGESVCASVVLPGKNGKILICTAVEPIKRCLAEMVHHASETDVDTAAVVGALPEMGCVLGAGTVVKEIAAAAPAIMTRPEAAAGRPFMVRIEPKASPALCALIALAQECAYGSAQACAEWRKLAQAAKAGGAVPVAQAMLEAHTLFCKATGRKAA